MPFTGDQIENVAICLKAQKPEVKNRQENYYLKKHTHGPLHSSTGLPTDQEKQILVCLCAFHSKLSKFLAQACPFPPQYRIANWSEKNRSWFALVPFTANCPNSYASLASRATAVPKWQLLYSMEQGNITMCNIQVALVGLLISEAAIKLEAHVGFPSPGWGLGYRGRAYHRFLPLLGLIIPQPSPHSFDSLTFSPT